jgi:hypothetical protein
MIDEELILFTLAERMALGSLDALRRSGPGHSQVHHDQPAHPPLQRCRAAQQPACFQTEWASDEQQVSGMPYKTTLMATWTIFQCIAKDKKALGTVENNLIIGGCRKVLAPQPGDPGFPDKRNTLNGLVHHCFISGRIFKDPGDIDDQGMIVIPIKLLVP